MKTPFAILALFSTLLLTYSVQAQNLIVNGDFEADTFTVFPGYAGGANPEAITGWVGSGNHGINPVFTVQNPASIAGQTRNADSVGRIGLNPVADETREDVSPFADNGDVDGGVLFLQNSSSVFQEISGLTAGEDYVLNVDYNARNCCGDVPSVSLELNQMFVSDFPDPNFDIVDPVVDGPWWNVEVPFTADSEDLRVEFFTAPLEGGDATFLLDNVSVTSAAGGDNLLVNGDFETDLELFSSWPGYLGNENAGPQSPFRDNGNNDTQVALMQNAGSIEQEVTGLTVGEEYTLSLNYNARDCCNGALPAPQFLLDDEPLKDFFADFEVVDPVGDGNDWYQFETTFVAEFETSVFKIQNMSDPDGGDATLVVDNVFLGIPGSALLGDFDGSGALGVADIDILSAAIAGGDTTLSFDLNEDGVNSIDDVNTFLEFSGRLNGDADFNGEVAFSDFLVLSENFGNSGDAVMWSGGDFDADGSVAFADFLILSENFGQGTAAPVPEASSLCLLMFGMVSVLSLRRRRAC